jgi:hypothetical protein
MLMMLMTSCAMHAGSRLQGHTRGCQRCPGRVLHTGRQNDRHTVCACMTVESKGVWIDQRRQRSEQALAAQVRFAACHVRQP